MFLTSPLKKVYAVYEALLRFSEQSVINKTDAIDFLDIKYSHYSLAGKNYTLSRPSFTLIALNCKQFVVNRVKRIMGF